MGKGGRLADAEVAPSPPPEAYPAGACDKEAAESLPSRPHDDAEDEEEEREEEEVEEEEEEIEEEDTSSSFRAADVEKMAVAP